jgi:hypothetical protein
MTKVHGVIIFFLVNFWAIVAGFTARLFTTAWSIIVAVMAVVAAFVFFVLVMIFSVCIMAGKYPGR